MLAAAQTTGCYRQLIYLRAAPPAARSRRQRVAVLCSARPDSPYEPLEKTIRAINRVIALGERAGWGSGEGGRGEGGSSGGGSQPQERWVQFGAVYNSSLRVEQAPRSTATTGSGRLQASPAASSSSSSSAARDSSANCSSSSNSANGDSSSAQGGGRQLVDYLALPVEQYSLLDPKWISRLEGGSFKFSLPLQDLVGVDLQPEITISVLSEPEQRRVTLVGTQAALGSPDIDSAFRLNVNTVIMQRQPRRLPALPRPPDHLPGRPVYRLRRWAAAARGRTWPPEEGSAVAAAAGLAAAYPQGSNGSSPSSSRSGSSQSGQAAAAPGVAAAAAAAAGVAPFPDQHVYISHDENDSDEYDLAELAVADVELAELDDDPAASSDRLAALAATEWAAAGRQGQPGMNGSGSGSGGRDDGGSSSSSSSASAANGSILASGGSNSSSSTSSSASAANGSIQASGGSGEASSTGQRGRPRTQGEQALLHCRTSVTMAVRVPGPLKVVPNPLLGYAGSMLLRTVLSATLPNFLELLAADYRSWAGISSGSGGSRELNGPVGELFSDAAALVRHERERRQHESEAGAGEGTQCSEAQQDSSVAR